MESGIKKDSGVTAPSGRSSMLLALRQFSMRVKEEFDDDSFHSVGIFRVTTLL